MRAGHARRLTTPNLSTPPRTRRGRSPAHPVRPALAGARHPVRWSNRAGPADGGTGDDASVHSIAAAQSEGIARRVRQTTLRKDNVRTLRQLVCRWPEEVAGKGDMFPAYLGCMGKEMIGRRDRGRSQMLDGGVHVDRVPIDDGGDGQVEAGCPILLGLMAAIDDAPLRRAPVLAAWRVHSMLSPRPLNSSHIGLDSVP